MEHFGRADEIYLSSQGDVVDRLLVECHASYPWSHTRCELAQAAGRSQLLILTYITHQS